MHCSRTRLSRLVHRGAGSSCKSVVSLVPVRHNGSKHVYGLGVMNSLGALAVKGRLRVHHALSSSRLFDSTFMVSGKRLGGNIPR